MKGVKEEKEMADDGILGYQSVLPTPNTELRTKRT